jgi:SIR2-like domain
MDIHELEDFANAQQLGRSLWHVDSGRRGAGVLVGAGFSRNAKLTSENAPLPPLWSDLEKTMRADLYPGRPDDAPRDVLRLAEEYRAYFGQAALDAHLRTHIADSTWLPSSCHTRLLSLPWSDVLTTNFDTLLERAAQEDVGQAYETVRGVGDLVHGRAPRIVKLHGTIGQNEQLVITEEDYRTYPTCRAAFVNLARQVFIENELCLLGFSGTDPNFLQWSGWVRDHLSGGQRRIFLVGVLELSGAARTLLKSRGVSVVDLAPLVSHLDNRARHLRATEMFLSFLEAARPRALHTWEPATQNRSRPELPSSGPARNEEVKKWLLADLDCWRKDRASYPGWLICPPDCRRRVRMATGNAVWDFERCRELLSDQETAAVVLELVWRYETALWPLPEALISAVELVAAMPNVGLDDSTSLRLVLLRVAREAGDNTKFDSLAASIRQVACGANEFGELAFQECLRARDMLDFKSIEGFIEKVQGSDPVWMLRKSSLHAALQQWPQARILVRDALIELRRRERADSQSLWARSRRAWAIWLSNADRRASDNKLWDKTRVDDVTALDQRSKCDAWEEFQYLATSVAEAVNQKHQDESGSYLPDFKPGVYKDGRNVERFVSHTVVGPAYELQRVAEIVGISASFDHINLLPMALESVTLQAPSSPTWYTAFLRFRPSSSDDRLVLKHLSRVAIACVPQPVVDSVTTWLVSAVEYWHERASQSANGEGWSSAIDELRTTVNLLYRFSPRQSPLRAREQFRVALALGADRRLTHHWLFEAIDNLALYSAEALGPNVDEELFLEALEFPLSIEMGGNASDDQWPNPIAHLRPLRTGNRSVNELRWSSRVQALIAATATLGRGRAEAVFRLSSLQAANLLLPAEVAAFSSALWSAMDSKSPSLPVGTNLYQHVFVDLPHPPTIEVTTAVAQRLFVDPESLPIDLPRLEEIRRAVKRESRPVCPTHSQAAALFDVLVGKDLETWREDHQVGFGMRKKSYKQVVGEILANGAAPFLVTSDLTQVRAEQLLSLCTESHLIDALPAVVDFSHLGESIRDRSVERIRTALMGREWRAVSSAAAAVARWCRDPVLVAHAQSTERLVDGLIAVVQLGREIGLVDVLHFARQVVEAGVLSDQQQERLCQALANLIEFSDYEGVDPLSRRAISISLVRARCAELAHVVLPTASGQSAERLQEFLRSAMTDPLPEVRYALA